MATTAVGAIRRGFLMALLLGASSAAALPGAGGVTSRALLGASVASAACACGAERTAAFVVMSICGASAAAGVGVTGIACTVAAGLADGCCCPAWAYK